MKDNLNFHGFEICVILRCTCLPDIIWFKEKKYLVYHGFLATCTEEQSRLFVKNFQRNWNWKSKKNQELSRLIFDVCTFLKYKQKLWHKFSPPIFLLSNLLHSLFSTLPIFYTPYLPHFYFLEATGLIDNYGWSHSNIKQLRAR